jgi:hypothetical protein
MYINAVADSVMLYLQLDFYNIIFKMKHKLCSLRVSPSKEKFWVSACIATIPPTSGCTYIKVKVVFSPADLLWDPYSLPSSGYW